MARFAAQFVYPNLISVGSHIFMLNFIVVQITLGEEGWKERFYAEKFGAKKKNECHNIRRHAVKDMFWLWLEYMYVLFEKYYLCPQCEI